MVESGLASVLPKVSTAGILNGVLITIVALLAIGAIGAYIYYIMRKKKYSEFKVEILDKDSNGNVYKTYDKAGVFLDKKTGFKLLFLEKNKIGMNPNKIPYISHKDGKGRLIKTVYLRRIGVNNYVFINMKLGETIKFTVGEEDLNNAQQEMVKIRRTYNKESWLSKYAPYITFIITILIVMIVLISLFNKFGVIKEASDNMVEVSKMQLEIMQIMKNATVGTTNTGIGTPIILK